MKLESCSTTGDFIFFESCGELEMAHRFDWIPRLVPSLTDSSIKVCSTGRLMGFPMRICACGPIESQPIRWDIRRECHDCLSSINRQPTGKLIAKSGLPDFIRMENAFRSS